MWSLRDHVRLRKDRDSKLVSGKYMLEWFIDLITSIITWVLALFGIDYAKIGSAEGEKHVEIMPHPEVIPDTSARLP